MDNLTHSLVGWAVAEAGLKNRTRKGLAACVLAANMPDIDVFFGWAPWAPLAMHRGFTHGLVGGVMVMPLMLAALLWLLDRWQRVRGRIDDGALPMHFGWLVTVCYLGALTHPLLDLQNVYAVQLMSPLSDRWFHTDGLFIVSPWLLTFLGLGIWMARRTGKGAPALASLGATLAFILINIGISQMAGDALRMSARYPVPDRVFASPEPLLFWRRDMLWRQDGMIGRAQYDPLRSLMAVYDHQPPLPDRMADPLVRRAAIATHDVRDFLAWSQMPFAMIEQRKCIARVTFGDARFAEPAMRENFNASAMIAFNKAECAAAMVSNH